jgi:integrase
MRALGDRPATQITPAEVEAVLATVEATKVGPRTVNKYRATMSAVFAYAQKPTTVALANNPAKVTDRRQRPALDTYTVAEIEQLARALQDGRHRDPARPASNNANCVDDCLVNDLVPTEIYTGLRQGELRALRWRDVGEHALTVSRALSAGVESGTKGGRVRHVPLVPQAAAALERLR